MLTWVLGVQLPEGGSTTLFYHTVLTGNGLSRTKRAIARLLGGDEEFDWEHFRPSAVAEQFSGRDCRVVVRIQNSPEYGKSNSVSDLLAPTEDQGFM
jgi:hypothetical protein